MYINPFLAGIIFTILLELALLIVLGIYASKKSKKK